MAELTTILETSLLENYNEAENRPWASDLVEFKKESTQCGGERAITVFFFPYDDDFVE